MSCMHLFAGARSPDCMSTKAGNNINTQTHFSGHFGAFQLEKVCKNPRCYINCASTEGALYEKGLSIHISMTTVSAKGGSNNFNYRSHLGIRTLVCVEDWSASWLVSEENVKKNHLENHDTNCIKIRQHRETAAKNKSKGYMGVWVLLLTVLTEFCWRGCVSINLFLCSESDLFFIKPMVSMT